LSNIGFASLKDVFRNDNGRLRMRNLYDMPDHVVSAISHVDVDEDGEAHPRFHNKIAALAQLAKNLGVSDPVVATQINVVELAKLPDDKLATLEAIVRAITDARDDPSSSGLQGPATVRGEPEPGSG
jgi:hypothetical protein